MRFIASLLTLILGSALLVAQDNSQSVEMIGTICDSGCVSQTGGQAACELKCSKKGGDAIFIEDNGTVTKIANPDKVKGYMGKHVKANCKMMDDATMWFNSLSIYG